METLNIKNRIEELTGLKVSIKKGRGSEKGYTIFTARNKKEWSFDNAIELREEFEAPEPNPTFCNSYRLSVYEIN